jgi:hypothetical protein
MRIPGNKKISLLLATLIALGIAGCGGGGDETETTTPTVEEPTALTKAEVIDEGDGICAEVNAAVGALASPETAELGGSSEETEKVANLYTGMVERLQDLGTPEGDEGDYAKFMEAAEELAKVEGELKLAAEREDLEAIGEANGEAEVALEEFHSQAAIYGFEDCSEDPGELPTPAGGGETEVPGEESEGLEEEGGVEPEFEEEVAPEEEIVPEEEVAPETGGAGGGVEETPTPEPAPETGGESGGVGPG